MNIQTKYFGEIEVDETKQIQFSMGLPGFEDETAFILLDLPDNDVFQLLQSTLTPSLAFVVVNPYYIYSDYVVDLDDNILDRLQIRQETDVSLFAIVTLASPFAKSTLNLKAPVVINANCRTGKQYILDANNYSAKTPISSYEKRSVKGEQTCWS